MISYIGIDPGPTKSAWVVAQAGDNYSPLESMKVDESGHENNSFVRDHVSLLMSEDSRRVIIEMPEARVMMRKGQLVGQPAGRDTLETARWAGRFEELAFDHLCASYLLFRRDVKLILCNNVRAGDKDIRRAILDFFGGETKAKGRKADPGPLYGIGGTHKWAALGLIVCHLLNGRNQ